MKPNMKNLSVLVLLMIPLIGFGQKKENGKIYIEHPAIDVVDAFTKAMVAGDTTAMGKLMTADFRANNPVSARPHDKGADRATFLRNAKSNFDNFDYYSIKPVKGAYPDAFEYLKDPSDNEAVTVESWDIVKGIHKKTGVKADSYLHRSFTLTKDNKIRRLFNYMNPEVRNNIIAASSERKNGIVYNEHPNINTLRLLMGAAENGDLAKVYSFYDPKATLFDSNADERKAQSLEVVKASHKAFFEKFEMSGIEQVGYPDYVVYEQGNIGVLYSWWNFYFIRKSDKKEIKVPFHYSHDVNAEGKIVSETAYYNGNLLK
ncbi:MAG: nuclear transport factor 2 family protein [Leadbetterella sp.]|nr:nuclear transport factor 2 family protein [Leadbetterella sp.]